MGRLIPFGNIPDSTIFPDGIFRLQLEKVEAVMTKEREGKTSKLMYKTTSKVVEPKSHAGLFFFENFVIGTDNDPEAEELATWTTSFGGRNWKKLCAKTGVPFGDEEDEESYFVALKGANYLATIVQKVDDGSRDASRKGNVFNNVTAYWSLGEKEAALANGNASTTKPRSTKSTTTAAAAASDKPAPSDDVTCTACRKRVPRKDLKAHVEKHMQDLASAGGNTDGAGANSDDE